jgi:branched-chain amino acid aminotransferase
MTTADPPSDGKMGARLTGELLWFDGQVASGADIRIDPADRGLLLGDGLFETLLVRDGEVEHEALHLQRLRNSATMLGIPLPYDGGAISDGMRQLLRAAGLLSGLVAARITLTRGAGRRGLLPPDQPQPHLMMTAVAYHPPQAESFSARIVAIRRNEGSPLSRLKSLNYLDNILALQEAVAGGADEALLRNNVGQICGGSRSNLFVIRAGQLITPPITDGVLDGIQRQVILRQARAIGCPVSEASLSPMDLLRVDEAFLSNSLMGIKPLHRIDEHVLHPGAVTEVLIDMLAELRTAGAMLPADGRFPG